MSRKQRDILIFAILSLFLLPTLFINFFHTEKNIHGSNACPACHFQNSTLATSQIPFFLLPQLTLLEILNALEVFQYKYLICVEPTSRAPPQA